MFVPGKPFQPSLRLSDKADSTLEQAPGVTLKFLTRLERLAWGKHYSLLRTFVNYGLKKLYNIGLKSTTMYQQCMTVKNNVKGFPFASPSHTHLLEKLAILKMGEKSSQCRALVDSKLVPSFVKVSASVACTL